MAQIRSIDSYLLHYLYQAGGPEGVCGQPGPGGGGRSVVGPQGHLGASRRMCVRACMHACVRACVRACASSPPPMVLSEGICGVGASSTRQLTDTAGSGTPYERVKKAKRGTCRET
eukprot:364699-Chlamydomonas_euryale.AAC.15